MLYIVSTPIGHPKDITLRALDILQEVDSIIGEEQRVASTLLKKLNLSHKPLFLLNEHSKEEDLAELLKLCQEQKVALISDCGTPSFYDPGYQLVHQCRMKNIPITAVPGASSLMTLLSLVSQRVNQFYFAGFLAADSKTRSQQISELRQQKESFIIMDTPYRLIKTLEELNQFFAQRTLLLGLNLTQEHELILEGTPLSLIQKLKKMNLEKAEFIILIYKDKSQVKQRQQQTFLSKTPSHQNSFKEKQSHKSKLIASKTKSQRWKSNENNNQKSKTETIPGLSKARRIKD